VDIRRQDSGGLAHYGNRGNFYARSLKEDEWECIFLLFSIAFDVAHYRHNFRTFGSIYYHPKVRSSGCESYAKHLKITYGLRVSYSARFRYLPKWFSCPSQKDILIKSLINDVYIR
jgi:hypothetical protein